MVTFLGKVFDSSKSLKVDLLSIYKPLAETAIANFSLRKSLAPQARPTYGFYGTTVQTDTRKPALDGHALASVLGQCRELGFHECASMLAAKVAAQTASMDPLDFNITILRFLQGIIIRL